MAVTEQTPRNASTATAGATVFPYDFKIISKDDLLVKVDGVVKVVDVDFTVSGVGTDAGGDITFATPMTGGEFVLRKRNMVFQRQADYQNLGDLRSFTLNNDQDAPVLMLQQLKADLGRTAQLPDDSTASAQLPMPVSLNVIGWNEAESGLRNIPLPDAGTGTFTPGYPGAVGARLVADRLREIVSARDFGAVGDGETDDTAAFTALEVTNFNARVDLGGNIYRVDEPPAGNRYVNGVFATSDTALFPAEAARPDRFHKHVVHRLPRVTTQYSAIVAARGYTYIYPQGFYVDERANELLILFEPTGGADDDSWVEVRDWTTGVHKTMFTAGESLGESLSVIYDGSTRYLLKKDSIGVMGKYNITTLPGFMDDVAPAATYSIGMQSQFSVWGDSIYVASGNNPVGGSLIRTQFVKYDRDFNVTGSLSLPRQLSGHSDLAYSHNFPKRQGFAAGPGLFAVSTGSNTSIPSAFTDRMYYPGVALLDGNGAVLAQSICTPNGFAQALQGAGYLVTRVENEGCWISSAGVLYSMFVIETDTGEQTESGIVILEEFSKSPLAIDFTAGAAPTVGVSIPDVYWPRNNVAGTIIDPNTGAVMDSLDDICSFMESNNVRVFSFYTSTFTGITDFNAAALPSTRICTIYNGNNATMWYELIGSHGTRRFLVNGTPRVQAEWSNRIPSLNSASASAGLYSGTGTPEGVVAAVVGSLFLRLDGSTSTTLYVKTSGTGNTGWTAK